MAAGFEDARQCQRCNHQWYATRAKQPKKPRWFDETGAIWTDGQVRMARLQGNYDRAYRDRERWTSCPACGSNKVKTVPGRKFVPSAAAGPGAPAAAATQTSVPVAPSPPVPVPGPGSRESLGLRCACGQVVALGARFCSACGQAMPEVGTHAPVPAPPTTASAPPVDVHPRLAFLRAEAAAKAQGDRKALASLRKAERDRKSGLRLRENMAEAKYDVQFKQTG